MKHVVHDVSEDKCLGRWLIHNRRAGTNFRTESKRATRGTGLYATVRDRATEFRTLRDRKQIRYIEWSQESRFLR